MMKKFQKDLLSHFLQVLPYLILFYFGNKMSWLYQRCTGGTFLSRLGLTFRNMHLALRLPIFSIDIMDLLVGIGLSLLALLLIRQKQASRKKFRTGEEYGSARWGTAKDIAPFIDPDPQQNIILTKTESLTMRSRLGKPEYERNKNVVVIGGSGSGKTRFYIKPNLMQMAPKTSYILTDPKGELLRSCGKMLSDHGVRVLIFDLINLEQSMKYNPFQYIHSETDILKLVNVIIENTKSEGERSSDGFWEKAERLLYSALIGYIWYEAPEEEQNISTLLELLNALEVKEEDEDYVNAVDLLFADLEKVYPDHFAVRQYRKFKQSAGKTAKSILISCGARLAPFDIPQLASLMSEDQLHLDTIGDQPTALFIIISDTDSTFRFVVAMLYSQLFYELCYRADQRPDGRLPCHVRLLLDEFANIGKIPNFDQLIATIRSREISASIVLQSVSQLKTMYKDSSETILGNCDSHLFLGGKEESTLKQISEALGKETIDLQNTSQNRGNSESFGTSFQKTGKPLMTRDELAVMDGRKCILQLRGVRPFLSDKYDITAHPRYAELAESTGKNLFDPAMLLKKESHHDLKLRLNEPLQVVDCRERS